MAGLVDAAPVAHAGCNAAASTARRARRPPAQHLEAAAAGASLPARRRGGQAARVPADGDGGGAEESLRVLEDGKKCWEVQDVRCGNGVSRGWSGGGGGVRFAHGQRGEEAAAADDEDEVDFQPSRGEMLGQPPKQTQQSRHRYATALPVCQKSTISPVKEPYHLKRDPGDTWRCRRAATRALLGNRRRRRGYIC
jgi:hypothetical protein